MLSTDDGPWGEHSPSLAQNSCPQSAPPLAPLATEIATSARLSRPHPGTRRRNWAENLNGEGTASDPLGWDRQARPSAALLTPGPNRATSDAAWGIPSEAT